MIKIRNSTPQIILEAKDLARFNGKAIVYRNKKLQRQDPEHTPTTSSLAGCSRPAGWQKVWRKLEGTSAEAYLQIALLGSLSKGNPLSLQGCFKVGLSPWSLPEQCHSHVPHWSRSWPTSQLDCSLPQHCGLAWQITDPGHYVQTRLWSWLDFQLDFGPILSLQICLVVWPLSWTRLPSLALLASLGVWS